MPGIALVTGANKGIGLEVVRQLATRGWRVFLTGRSLASVRKAASPLGPSVIPVPLDITSRISIEAAFSCRLAGGESSGRPDQQCRDPGPRRRVHFRIAAERLRRMFETNTIGRCS